MAYDGRQRGQRGSGERVPGETIREVRTKGKGQVQDCRFKRAKDRFRVADSRGEDGTARAASGADDLPRPGSEIRDLESG
jgi:hypothetical protein